MRRLPFTEFPIAQLHLLPLIIKDVERLRRFGQKFYVHERRRLLKHGLAAFNADIEKNVSRAEQYEIGADSKHREDKSLRDVSSLRSFGRDRNRAHDQLADAHPVTRDQALREIVDSEREHKENETDHEQRAIMNTASHDFAHFLRDDSGHGVDRLEKCAEPLSEIRDRDAVSRAKQNHHRLADYATETEQDRGNNS